MSSPSSHTNLPEADWPGRWHHVDIILDRPGPSTPDPESFTPEIKEFLRDACKILVIGAGGLGCEILSNLAMTGFKDITVIDMDTIDVSNLNRQFLFRETDVGKPKATVAADFIMKRVPGCKVTAYFNKIQSYPTEFYEQFNLVITGLDSVEARRWMNATLCEMFDPEDPSTIKPMIDGGTEGFKGQATVILPGASHCYECTLHMHTPPTAFPICTIANTPRLPEHCIEWASVLEWPKVFKDKKLDTDDPVDIEWLYRQAQSRAEQYNIEGVTWSLTQGVVKNIIPAIASTNAIIAASCCNEAFKLATGAAPYLDSYMMYVGNDSVYTYTFKPEKRPDCLVCGGATMEVDVGLEWTVERLYEWLKERQDLQLKKPSLSTTKGPLYFAAPPSLESATRPNLGRFMRDVVGEGDEIEVTDQALPSPFKLKIRFGDEGGSGGGGE